MPRKQRFTTRVARARIKFLEAQLEHKEQSILDSHKREQRLDEQLKELHRTVNDRLLRERRELAQALASLTESVSKAIVYVIGKEQL